MNLRLITNLLILFSLISIGFSISADINISEEISAVKISSSQINISGNGTLIINNPSSNDYIHQFEFDFRSDLILDFDYSNPNLSSNIDSIFGEEIRPNNNFETNYTFSGIIPISYYENFKARGISVLDWYTQDIYLNTNREISLSKLSRDNADTTNISSRGIGISGRNPTEFNLSIEYINLITTNSSNNNEFLESENIINTYQNFNLNPNQSFQFDFTDTQSSDFSIYWIDSKISAFYNINNDITLSFSDKSSESSKGSSRSFSSLNYEKEIIFEKFTNQSIIKNGDLIKIKLSIQNPNKKSIKEIYIQDIFPEEFKLLNGSSSKLLKFEIEELFPFETMIFEYTLNFSQNSSTQVFYLPRAKLSYKSGEILSNFLNLVNKNQEQRNKIIIEKEINYIDDERVETKITVKNLGDKDIENLKIIESPFGFLRNGTDNESFRSWLIPSIPANGEWEITYITNRENVNPNSIQAILNEKIQVLNTLIVNSNIIFNLEKLETNKIIFSLVTLAFILIIIDIIF